MRPYRWAWRGLLVGAFLVGPAYALIAGPRGAVVASLFLSLATVGLAVAARRDGRREVRILLALALAAGVPVHYAATARVFEALGLPLLDDALAAADTALLGGVWPGGQLAIALDQSPVLGPTTLVGRALTELFQVGYFSYYVWGYGLLFLLVARFARQPAERGWDALRAFLTAWVGAYLVNFILYLVVPAMGPWWAYPDWFAHPLEGLWLTEPIRTLIAANQVTPDCFPSGHTALSWITAIVALRTAPRYGRACLVAAAVITVATLTLRYHYAVDVLGAVPLIFLALGAGGWLRGLVSSR